MIRSSLVTLFFAVLMLLPMTTLSQDDFLRVSAPGNRQMRLSILPPRPSSGEPNQNTAAEIAEIFKLDLGITGLFSIVEQSEADKGGADL